ncbi:hypothetical protein [Actinomadura monticuli]|uniref:DUF4177 domain-containing protein n=1 Tax=Actinomadura monticuli TaxID=3097367 RepID=A0ABV4Q868_9ACTN
MWNYLVLECFVGKWQGLPRAVGYEYSSLEEVSVQKVCDHLGGQGWELAGVLGDRTSFRLFFKQPRA